MINTDFNKTISPRVRYIWRDGRAPLTVASIAQLHCIKAFTLIEMTVVMSVITTVMALGVPALVTAQRQSDQYATDNIIYSIHSTCQRNAQQFGSASLIYGFTISYSSDLGGRPAADAITPWVVNDKGNLGYHNDVGLRVSFGMPHLWSGDDIVFTDLDRPCSKVVINGVSHSVSAGDHLHVAYEPITGFPHTMQTLSKSARPTPPDIGAGTFTGISDPLNPPSHIELSIWSKRSEGVRSRIVMHKTGVFDVRGGP